MVDPSSKGTGRNAELPISQPAVSPTTTPSPAVPLTALEVAVCAACYLFAAFYALLPVVVGLLSLAASWFLAAGVSGAVYTHGSVPDDALDPANSLASSVGRWAFAVTAILVSPLATLLVALGNRLRGAATAIPRWWVLLLFSYSLPPLALFAWPVVPARLTLVVTLPLALLSLAVASVARRRARLR